MDNADREEHRRLWRAEWLSRVQEMADQATQRATWLNPSPRTWNPHYSYVEYATTYLQYADWPDRVCAGLLTKKEAMLIADLDERVRAYKSPTNDFDHEAILDDPAWLKINQTARQVQEELASVIKHPYERLALLERSEHALEAAQRAT